MTCLSNMQCKDQKKGNAQDYNRGKIKKHQMQRDNGKDRNFIELKKFIRTETKERIYD